LKNRPQTTVDSPQSTHQNYAASECLNTAGSVLARILKSNHKDQLSMYSMSNSIHLSNETLLRPLICQRQVMPGRTGKGRGPTPQLQLRGKTVPFGHWEDRSFHSLGRRKSARFAPRNDRECSFSKIPKKLREFIHTRFSQKLSDRGNPRIILYLEYRPDNFVYLVCLVDLVC
jgi:hypothetical protein